MTDVDVDVVVRRRSTRKRRAQWREQLDLSLRASRASGDNPMVPVKSRGGQPSHKRFASSQSAHTSHASGEMHARFCSECGHKFTSDRHKFCVNFGTKRDVEEQAMSSSQTAEETLLSLTASTKTTMQAENSCAATAEKSCAATAEKSGAGATNVENSGETNAEKSGAAAAENSGAATAENAGAARLQPQYLRCGWRVCGDKFIAPDDKQFTCRKKAAKYHNKNIPKLEPQRKDNW